MNSTVALLGQPLLGGFSMRARFFNHESRFGFVDGDEESPVEVVTRQVEV